MRPALRSLAVVTFILLAAPGAQGSMDDQCGDAEYADPCDDPFLDDSGGAMGMGRNPWAGCNNTCSNPCQGTACDSACGYPSACQSCCQTHYSRAVRGCGGGAACRDTHSAELRACQMSCALDA